MDKMKMVREFHSAFGASENVELVQGKQSLDLLALRLGLVAEEYKEVAQATTDLGNALFMKRGDETITKRKEELLKELADVLYVVYGFAVTYGWDLDEAFRRTHVSNMSKLGEDGKPILRDDGKVLKGPNYAKPDLSGLV